MKAIEEITRSVVIDGPHLFGNKLSFEDAEFFNFVVKLQLDLLLDNIPDCRFKDVRRMCQNAAKEMKDIEKYLTSLGACDDALLKLRLISDVNAPLSSSYVLKTTLPLIGNFESVRLLLLECRPSYKTLHTFFLFLKKIDFGQDYGSLANRCFVNLQKTQSRLAALHFDEETRYDIWNLRQIMSEWLSAVPISLFRPHHGKGVVAEVVIGRDKNLKSQLMTTTIDQEILLDRLGFGMRDFNPYTRFVMQQPPARFISVPKAWNKRRGICAEPAGNQFFQQGIKEVLYDYISHHEYLGRRIKLRDQTVNQSLAKTASVHGYATTDLSDASDSVSLPLVELIFADTPLIDWFMASRSTCCSYEQEDGSVVILPLISFSPMGSAVCFPLECLVFAACCEYISRQYGDLASREFDNLTNWSVFGDDIIIKDFMSKRLRRLLRRLGFIINETKSFSGGPFAESCGGEYLNGRDVTPLRCKFSPFICSTTAESYVKLRDFCNTALSRGFLTTRYAALRFLMDRYKPVFTDDPAQCHKVLTLGSVRNDVTRRNHDYQVTESLGSTLVCLEQTRDGHTILSQQSAIADEMEYLAWLRKKQIRPDDEGTSSTSSDPFHSNPQWSKYRIRDKWIL